MLVDSYYAMTADRPYRAGMPQEKALRIIEEETGRQFEPDLAKRFIEFMREGEVDLELVQFHPHLGV
jgi:HD-GYP domain-containing protein (c-di-GMP phosphodiesterase class II)